jgi:xylulokinase
MPLLIGIDIGTSSTKAVLFDPDSARLAAVSRGFEYPILKPRPDQAEQDPDHWWRASVAAVRAAMEQVEPVEVGAISFSAQMHATVLVDAANRPVRPAIIWPDQRTVTEVHDLIETVGAERYAAITGTLPATGFMAPTLLWLLRHEPDSLAQARYVMLVKDYVRLKMTGVVATDPTDAAGSGLFDVTRKTWAHEIIQAVGLPESIFPPVIDSTAVAGELTPAAADDLGLPGGIPVVAGSADQPAQAIANGLIAPGKAVVATGSGGQVVVPLALQGDLVPTDPRLHVFNHAVPEMWYVLGAILAAGLGLRWLRGITGLEGKPDAYQIFSNEAASLPPGADGLLFLPYLSGERTPHMDPLARGGFIGLNYHHGRGHLARAVMEGVAFALRQALEISQELGGTVETVIVTGGGAESAVWRQIQADVFNLPLQQSLLTELASVGAALIGGVGAGIYPDFAAATEHVVQYGAITEPDPARAARYTDLYQQFLGLYPRLRDDFHWLARFSSE